MLSVNPKIKRKLKIKEDKKLKSRRKDIKYISKAIIKLLFKCHRLRIDLLVYC